MAVSQSKRSVYKKQSAAHPNTRKRTARKGEFALPVRKVVQFPQAKGKLVKGIEFSSEPGHDGISINFRDKTCLNFAIRTGSRWKSSIPTGEPANSASYADGGR